MTEKYLVDFNTAGFKSTKPRVKTIISLPDGRVQLTVTVLDKTYTFSNERYADDWLAENGYDVPWRVEEDFITAIRGDIPSFISNIGKCTCGVDAVGGGKHSSYCDKGGER